MASYFARWNDKILGTGSLGCAVADGLSVPGASFSRGGGEKGGGEKGGKGSLFYISGGFCSVHCFHVLFSAFHPLCSWTIIPMLSCCPLVNFITSIPSYSFLLSPFSFDVIFCLLYLHSFPTISLFIFLRSFQAPFLNIPSSTVSRFSFSPPSLSYRTFYLCFSSSLSILSFRLFFSRLLSFRFLFGGFH